MPHVPFSRLRVPRAIETAMCAHAAREYPYECCGLLIGTPDGTVREIHAVPNIETSRRRDRYTMDPLVYRQVEQRADAHGWRILAVYHSHPDHPARPSETDRSRAWPDFVYIVMRVTAQGVDAWTAWVLNDAGVFVPFPTEVVD